MIRLAIILLSIFSILLVKWLLKKREMGKLKVCKPYYDSDIKILILSGTHGNEPSPSNFFFDQCNATEFITIIPRVNEFALQNNMRGIPDVNRNYPDGTEINRTVLPYILAHDMVIDFHEGFGNKCSLSSLGQSFYTNNPNLYEYLDEIIEKLNRNETEECLMWRRIDNLPKTEEGEGCGVALDEFCQMIGKSYILVELQGQNSGISMEKRYGELDIIYKEILKRFGEK